MHTKSLALLSLGFGQALAAGRPSSTSVCDYYTTALLKDNTPANQYTLLTLLVNTAVIGNYTQPNVGIKVPGILAPATVNGEAVNLLPYFNGCLESTNVNDHPSSVNFLDGGGAAPLMKNLPADNDNSNQYFLLTHLYQFFGKLLGCSGYGEMGFPSYGGDPSMYNVHKYMSLHPAEVTYFISQVGASAASFGVSNADVTAFGGVLMQYFGYKCSPPMDIGIGGTQLESICSNAECPLDPKSQCSAYPENGQGEPDPKLAPQCAKSSSSSSNGGGYGKPTSTQSYSQPKSTHWGKW